MANLSVNASTFLQECITLARQNSQGRTGSRPTDTDFTDPSLYDEHVSSGSPPNAISKVEATFYYSGISNSPPKLVYLTSKDPFVMPKGPEAYRRLKYLYPVYDHKLGDKWGDLGPKVRHLLDEQQVRLSTIDLVRFRTVPDQQTPVVIGPVVIWIGVLPDSLTGEDAFNTANAILALLEDEGITAVNIEFRESVFRRSASAELYEPASDLDATRHVIDPLTTALGLPISAAKTPHLRGTMGFYFKNGDDLYGVTARHVLFPADEDNSDYTYNPSRPRKEVLLMGTKAWDDYLKSIQIRIGNLGTAAEIYRESIRRLEGRALLEEATNAIDELQELYERSKKDFGKQSQRVIGHVVWSPAIAVGTVPHSFTKDVCVVELDKARFLPNFKGNVIDLDRGRQVRCILARTRSPASSTQPNASSCSGTFSPRIACAIPRRRTTTAKTASTSLSAALPLSPRLVVPLDASPIRASTSPTKLTGTRLNGQYSHMTATQARSPRAETPGR